MAIGGVEIASTTKISQKDAKRDILDTVAQLKRNKVLLVKEKSQSLQRILTIARKKSTDSPRPRIHFPGKNIYTWGWMETHHVGFSGGPAICCNPPMTSRYSLSCPPQPRRKEAWGRGTAGRAHQPKLPGTGDTRTTRYNCPSHTLSSLGDLNQSGQIRSTSEQDSGAADSTATSICNNRGQLYTLRTSSPATKAGP